MWCDNLPRNRGRLSQVTSPYKLFINNHSVTFDRNPVLYNCSQEFTRNFDITAFLKIKRAKYKNLQTKSVTISPGLPYTKYSLNLTFGWECNDTPALSILLLCIHRRFERKEPSLYRHWFSTDSLGPWRVWYSVGRSSAAAVMES